MTAAPGRDVLLDTGPIVALLDARDQWHTAARTAANGVLRRCLTTEAVATEASHLLAARRGDPSRALEFLLALDIPIVALHRPMHEACIALMRRYADVPMDYADATLVAAAGRLRIERVFTFDRRGFHVYRGLSRRAALRILP